MKRLQKLEGQMKYALRSIFSFWNKQRNLSQFCPYSTDARLIMYFKDTL